MSTRKATAIVSTIDGIPIIRGPESFEVFYRREFPKMVTLAYAVTGSFLAAEDVAQDALIAAGNRWQTLADYDKPGAWLRRVTIQRASKRARRARLERAVLERFRTEEAIPPGPPDVEEVLAAVRRLPTQQRAAIALHYFDGYSVEEVAAILECAAGTAKVHLHKGRRALAKSLGEGRER
jgi:RNA polymerase sigma-70 factor (ECF subfamily)